jgi:hypothetical protein
MLACSGSVSGRMERSALLEGTTQQNFSSLFAQAKRKGKTEVGGTAARAIRAAKCSRVESLTGRHYITLLGLSQMTLGKKKFQHYSSLFNSRSILGCMQHPQEDCSDARTLLASFHLVLAEGANPVFWQLHFWFGELHAGRSGDGSKRSSLYRVKV